jgi:acyl-coenzyme A thioesterase PaaI-like protein
MNSVVHDPVLERALLAVGRTRALGLHFYGHFLGIEGDFPRDGRATLRLIGEPPGVGTQSCSMVSVATLADLALGAAIRSMCKPGERLGTVTLSVQHLPTPTDGPLHAEAYNVQLDGDLGMSQCICHGPRGAVALAQGRFVRMQVPEGRSWKLMPWEQPPDTDIPTPSIAELDDDESLAIESALLAGVRAITRRTNVSAEILNFQWADSVENGAGGIMPVGPHVANRAGHVQGGALYGAAAMVAERALNAPGWSIADGHYQFLRPGDGDAILATATVLRRGRRMAYVVSRLRVGETIIGSGLFTLRAPD